MADSDALLSVTDFQPSPDKPEIVVGGLCRNGVLLLAEDPGTAKDPSSTEKLHRQLASACAENSSRDIAPSVKSLAMQAFGSQFGEGTLVCADGHTTQFEVPAPELEAARKMTAAKMQRMNLPEDPELASRLYAAETAMLNARVAVSVCPPPGSDSPAPDVTPDLPKIEIKAGYRR